MPRMRVYVRVYLPMATRVLKSMEIGMPVWRVASLYYQCGSLCHWFDIYLFLVPFRIARRLVWQLLVPTTKTFLTI